MELFKYDNLRVSNIIAFDGKQFSPRPVSEGLAIEYRYQQADPEKNKKDWYIVIAFVYPDKEETSYYYKSVLNRIEEYLKTMDDIENFRLCLNICEKEFKKEFRKNDKEE